VVAKAGFRRLALGSGIAFGVVDVLAPLRLARLGASGAVIAATFLCAASSSRAYHRSPAGSATATVPVGRC
jgi:hypothetical protein